MNSRIDHDLAGLVGKRVARVEGYPSKEFGEPVFKIYRIVYEDGTTSFVEGEHDMAYIPCGPELSPERLLALMDSEDAP